MFWRICHFSVISYINDHERQCTIYMYLARGPLRSFLWSCTGMSISRILSFFAVSLGVINSYSTTLAGRTQVVFTFVKLIALIIIVIGGIVKLIQGTTICDVTTSILSDKQNLMIWIQSFFLKICLFYVYRERITVWKQFWGYDDFTFQHRSGVLQCSLGLRRLVNRNKHLQTRVVFFLCYRIHLAIFLLYFIVILFVWQE